jgi:hypothetical protein
MVINDYISTITGPRTVTAGEHHKHDGITSPGERFAGAQIALRRGKAHDDT